MSILTFEGLSITFEASMNVYFTYFCHKIKCYIMVIYVLKLLAKCFLLITKQLGTHVQVASNIISSFGCSCKGQEQLKLLKYVVKN